MSYRQSGNKVSGFSVTHPMQHTLQAAALLVVNEQQLGGGHLYGRYIEEH